MDIFDSHCHIHQAQQGLSDNDAVRDKWLEAGKDDADQIIADAVQVGVTRMVCVGCDVADSKVAVEFVQGRPEVWASIGIHPHEAQRFVGDADSLVAFAELATRDKVVAVGECGLDFFYSHSPKDAQVKILRYQMDLALEHDLPMIFHVREAFEDFWPIFDSYKGIRGVIHSFTADRKVLDQVIERGLYVGINTIMTFSKQKEQLEAAKNVPLERLLLETDAPFLTPEPYRGTMCEPKHAATTMSFIAKLQGITDQQIAEASTQNAYRLFNLEG